MPIEIDTSRIRWGLRKKEFQFVVYYDEFPKYLACHRRYCPDTLQVEARGTELLEEIAFGSASNAIAVDFFGKVCDWGGNQHNVKEKVLSQLDSRSILHQIERALVSLSGVTTQSSRTLRDAGLETAASSMMELDGLGISYGTKVLRMLRPDLCGVMDSTVQMFGDFASTTGLSKQESEKISQANFSWYSHQCLQIAGFVNTASISPPTGANEWRVGDVDAVIFTAHMLGLTQSEKRWVL